MKKILFTILAASLLSMADAQVTTPQASPHARVESTVGLTNVSVEYSRPSAKDRKIFGGLVPMGKIWRTGANMNTLFRTNDDITFNGKDVLKAGTYSIYTIPNQDSWTVIFYSDTTNGGVPQSWNDKKIILKTQALVSDVRPNVETFTIDFENLTNNTAELAFSWQETKASVRFQVPTEEKTMTSIKETMKGKPTAQDLMAAGSYYYSNGKDIHQAMKWYDEGIKMTKSPKYYQLYQQALIHAKAGNNSSVIPIAKRAMEAAKKAGNDDYAKKCDELIRQVSEKK